MKTKPLMESGILNNGEPRHYSSWDLPELPRLNRIGMVPTEEALYRRQRTLELRFRRMRGGITQLWQSFRRT